MVNLHLHLYAPTSEHYSPTMFVNYLRGFVPDDPDEKPPVDRFDKPPKEPPVDRFEKAGVTLDPYSNVAHATADFRKSLRDDGSVVVYLGHGVPDSKCLCSRGLSWLGHGLADITPSALMDLLNDSRAKLVVLSTCASSTFGLKKLKAGPAVVVTNSGADLVTKSGLWGLGLQRFLLRLIGYEVDQTGHAVVGWGPVTEVGDILKNIQPRGTIRQAVDAANEAFKAYKSDDRCELAHGEGSTVVFP